jgi:hypothetical protein
LSLPFHSVIDWATQVDFADLETGTLVRGRVDPPEVVHRGSSGAAAAGVNGSPAAMTTAESGASIEFW